MGKKKKAATADTVAASQTTWASPKHNTSKRVQSVIVQVALWGIIPPALAEWIIRIGGLRHD